MIVIDEYAYLCEEDPSTDSYLQIFIDHDLQDTNALLIICGSAIKTMERIFTDGKGALFRRFIGPMKIEPLSYGTCRRFHPNMSEPDRMRLYSLVGGIPLYHLMMNGDTVEDCIKDNILGPYAPLREEASLIIARELEPASTNLAILRAISDGHTSGKEIAEATRQSKENCYVNLRNLETIGIVSPLAPMCGANRKERIYRISDNLVRLNNEVLVPFSTVVSGSDKDGAYDRVSGVVNTFYGPGFEEICRQYIREHHTCVEMGAWWGMSDGESTEVDIVALIGDGQVESHLVCECKFRNKEYGMRELNELKRKAGSMRNCFNRRYVLFSRSGFTEELEEYASSASDVELLTPEDMYKDERL